MFVLLFFVSLLLAFCYWHLTKPKNLPPGPSGIPFLGYLPWLLYYAGNRLELFDDLKRKYGRVVCLRVGFNYMIILNDLEIIKEAFANKGDQFSGRGLKMVQQGITGGKGILSSEGTYQRENRRFILRSLRNMGFGKMSFEEPILETVKNLCSRVDEHISSHPNEAMDLRFSLVEAVADNITQIILGLKFNKEQLDFIITRLKLLESIPVSFFMLNSLPFLLPLLKFKTFRDIVGLEKLKSLRMPLEEMVLKFINEHKNSFDKDNIDDFIYSYIDEQTLHKESKLDAFWWDDQQIKHACTELLGAGMGTTESTITWSLMLMANNQAWQKKVQKEIQTVIGLERAPSTRDITSLPMCEATILEILRWSSLAPTGIPHAVLEATHLDGYYIPKDATVMANLYSVSRDPSSWHDPDNFNPEANFLSADRSHVINREKIIPFSVGRRSCIGESLARMEVTLFFLGMFQKYSVSLDSRYGLPKPSRSILRIPSHRKLVFHHRKMSMSA